MSALRHSTPGALRLTDLGPYEPWSLTDPLDILPGRLVGYVAVASDRVPFARAGSFDAEPRPKKLTEARRANNREAARRYRARRKAA